MPVPSWPLPVVPGGAPRQRSLGFPIHLLEPGGFIEEPYGDRRDLVRVRRRLLDVARHYSRSVAGRGREFTTRKLEGTVRLVRTR